ncbi:TIM barrel protein [Micromonospora sp. NPDC047738]|uniref:TIM barrel protein n=1 Tax=Micromonospora sp. NPDC047738 TaxID=3155741 RepID=UPI0034028F53
MKRLRKVLTCLAAAGLLSLAVPATAQAEPVAETGTLTLSVSDAGGGLQAAIDAAGAAYADVHGLVINGGMLNSTDSRFINQSLTGLTDLTVGGTADFVGSQVPTSAFSGNTSLRHVRLDNTTVIGSRAFYDVATLVTVEMPNVTILNGLAFNNNAALKSAYLPQLRSIDNRAFYGAVSMSSLTLGEEPPVLLGQGNWFLYVTGLTIYVPVESALEVYRNHIFFQQFRIRVIGDDGTGNPDDPAPPNTPELCAQYCGRIGGSDSVRYRDREYFRGDYKVSLNLYSFNVNINAWLNNRQDTPQLDTLAAIRWAAEAGFDAVDVTAYYIPGYSNTTMPTLPDGEIKAFARQIRDLTKELGIEISGTGYQNDFANPSADRRALDVERGKYWIDVAAEMDAPVIRVFSGPVPTDINRLGWETVTRERVVPALRQLAEYGAAKGVQIGLQNHGDMTATAGQTIQLLKWVDHDNIGIVNDTGYFRPFRYTTGLNYDWYADIADVLPYSNNFQVKKRPGGAETDTTMDLNKLFTDVRYSDYRGYIPLELLWARDEPGYPRDLPEPPYEQISGFLDAVKASLKHTKDQTEISGFTDLTYVDGRLSGTAFTDAVDPDAKIRLYAPDGEVIGSLSATLVGDKSPEGRYQYKFDGIIGDRGQIRALGPVGPSIMESVYRSIEITRTDGGNGTAAVYQMLDFYVSAGEVRGPLVPQLSNTLSSASHHLAKGSKDQAAKQLRNFLQHLDNPDMDSHVTATARHDLKGAAQARIEAWTK